jgi:hypothetical protein
MLFNHSIRSLYPLALAEGEGVGTAYEYVAKRQVLRRWLEQRPSGGLLVAGLPEIYGSSMDYLLIAEELKMPALVIDDRPELLDRARASLTTARDAGFLTDVQVEFHQVADLTDPTSPGQDFTWCICNEVLQRFDAAGRSRYTHRLAQSASLITLFAPNADNTSHTSVSGLSGLHLAQMQQLMAELGGADIQVGYCDMPPFPPGVSRSREQRAQAEQGRMEAAAMWGLAQYLRLESVLPIGWQRERAHIVYGLCRAES